MSKFDSQLEHEQVRGSLEIRAEPIHLAVDLGMLQCVEGTNVYYGTNKRKVVRKEGSVRTHGMKTRNKKIVGVLSWNLEVEYAKAIERQYYKRNGHIGDNIDTLSLEMEFSKILEIGVALGHDFQGREEELSQVIAQREEKDVVRYQKTLYN